jgi:hypothetical protein
MSWTLAERVVRLVSSDPAISVYKGGNVRWNQAAHSALGEPLYVELLVDRERKLLGIRRSEDNPKAFTVRHLPNRLSIAARPTLAALELGRPVTIRARKAEFVEGVLAIEVEELFA